MRVGAKLLIPTVIILALAAASLAVSSPFTPREEANEELLVLNGAGSTFAFPLISKWSEEYLKIEPKVQINYQSIGSGGGIRQHIAKTIDFAASDVPLTEEQWAKAPNTLHIPFTIGGVVPSYNVPSVEELRFTGEVLADIFLGKIKRWNDARLVELNPQLEGVEEDIVVIHRSDGSGTTYIWTSYLAMVSEEWREKVGADISVNWPVGLGGKGNEGVAGLLLQTPYSLGYLSFTYAILNDMSYGMIKNAAGEWVVPSLASFSKAATVAGFSLPKGHESWSGVSIVGAVALNPRAEGAWPLTSFVYLLVYRDLGRDLGLEEEAAKALAEWIWWIVHEGQAFASPLVYVPLPETVVRHNEETLSFLLYEGRRLLPAGP